LAGVISESEYYLARVIFALNCVKTWNRYFFMTLDAPELFASLAERERVHGHHSPEGEAMRTLSRALHGWSSGNLAGTDVVVLCAQAVEDWLKRRLKVSPWSAKSLNTLLAAAVAADVLPLVDAERLEPLQRYRSGSDSRRLTADDIETILQTSIEIVGQHWS